MIALHSPFAEPEVILTKSEFEARFGTQISVECKISNCPKKYEIFWQKISENREIKELQISDREEDKYSGSTEEYPHLIIKDINKEDAAFYSCHIEYFSQNTKCKVKSGRTRLVVLIGKSLDLVYFSIRICKTSSINSY